MIQAFLPVIGNLRGSTGKNAWQHRQECLYHFRVVGISGSRLGRVPRICRCTIRSNPSGHARVIQAFLPVIGNLRGSTGKNACITLELSVLADLALAVYHVFVGAQFVQTHRATRVETVGGDADFRAQAEFEAIGEAGGGIVIHGGGIDAC